MFGLNTFTPLWLLWSTGSLLSFLVVEFTGIWARRADKMLGNPTLSGLVWRITNARQHPVGRIVFFTIYAMGLGVLGTHFAFHTP